MAKGKNLGDGSYLHDAPIDIATAGDHIIIAGIPGQAISVMGIEYLCAAGNVVTLKDGAGNVLLPGQAFAANGGAIRDLRSFPWYRCGVGEAFVVNLSASEQVSGIVYYAL